MPDPVWTDAVRDRIFNRLGFLGCKKRDFLLLGLFFSPLNADKYLVRMISGDETKALITNIVITRAKLSRQNFSGDTDVNGIVWGQVSDGGSGTGHSLDLWSTQDRSSTLVAQEASVVNDGGTFTITAESGFQIAGTITIGSITANVTFAFEVVPSPRDRLLDEFTGDELEDSSLRQDLEDVFDQLSADCFRAANRLERVAERFLKETVVRNLGFADSEVLHNAGQSRNSAGGIANAPSGLIETWRRAMNDNTGGSGAIKIRPASNTPTVSFPGTWTGRSGGISLGDRAVVSTILGTCVKGLDSAPPRFRIKLTATDPRKGAGARYTTFTAQFELTLGQTYRAKELGIESFLLEYAPTVSNESGTPLNTTGTNWSVTGLSTANSTNGQVWVHHDGTDLNFYKTQAGRNAQDASDVVASVPDPGTATAFEATGSAGLTISGTTGATAASGNTGNIAFNPPVATSPASYFQIAIAVGTEPGVMQRLVQRGLLGGASYVLHSDSTPNVVDSQVKAGSLLLGYKGFGDEI